MTEEKSAGYVRLVESFDEPGCPICRCVVRESRSHLDAILYEQVTDPDTRRALRASWGFCNWHTWMLLEITHAGFGSAIVYEDLLRLALELIGRLEVAPPRRRSWLSALFGRRRRPAAGDGYPRRNACPVCVTAADAERRYVDTLVRLFDDGDLLAAYGRSDGLCVSHLLAAAGTEAPCVPRLVARTREKWERVRGELQSFIGKHDHRNHEPFTAAEADSYTRAFTLLAGARGIFGNHLHRLPPPGPRPTQD